MIAAEAFVSDGETRKCRYFVLTANPIPTKKGRANSKIRTLVARCTLKYWSDS